MEQAANLITGSILPGKKIYLATPCYGGLMSAVYVSSLLKLEHELRAKHYGLHVHFKSNESLISRARNSIVADFLGHTDCDYLLFIDADIGFSAQTILTMLAYDKPVVAAKVPLKGLNWEAAYQQRQQVNSAQALQKAALIPNINYNVESKIPLQIDEKGFAKVEMAGTGLMLIKREVFDVLRQKLPDAQYVNDILSAESVYSKDNFWLFFEPMVHPLSKRYLSEDFAFCYRWRHDGQGDVYVYMNADVSHSGSYLYPNL